MTDDAARVAEVFRRTVEALHRPACPDCGAMDFLRGPRGGLAVNIRCGHCGHWFNVGPRGWFAERIRCDETCRLAVRG